MIITPDAVELFVASKWHIKHKDSRELYERMFREHFGVQPEMVAFLWNTLHAQNLDGDADFENCSGCYIFLNNVRQKLLVHTFANAIAILTENISGKWHGKSAI